jgi:hypothetical protein
MCVTLRLGNPWVIRFPVWFDLNSFTTTDLRNNPIIHAYRVPIYPSVSTDFDLTAIVQFGESIPREGLPTEPPTRECFSGTGVASPRQV